MTVPDDDWVAADMERRLRGTTATVAQNRIVEQMKQFQEQIRAQKAQEALAEEESPPQDGVASKTDASR